ncbi:hypothetical protein BKA82DRAFT_35456 [Pisolithus tinctorius]|nr:hypothetical protein BKA82DRAFT_4363738 [Pisolithus tinctorius]KAI6155873.1 hypothetical protein BKA82DRAFT_35456 [Pisolithus tinctorius]
MYIKYPEHQELCIPTQVAPPHTFALHTPAPSILALPHAPSPAPSFASMPPTGQFINFAIYTPEYPHSH